MTHKKDSCVDVCTFKCSKSTNENFSDRKSHGKPHGKLHGKLLAFFYNLLFKDFSINDNRCCISILFCFNLILS